MFNLKAEIKIDKRKRKPRYCNKCDDVYYNDSDLNCISKHNKCTFCYQRYLDQKRLDEVRKKIEKKQKARLGKIKNGYVGNNQSYILK